MKNYTIIIFLLISCSVFGQTSYYVDSVATGANNGLSWQNAFTDLTDAMNMAGNNDTVRIAKGTYKPTAFPAGCTNCSNPRDVTFLLNSGVVVFGGYPSAGGTDDTRDWEVNRTILDGDLGTPDDSTDNAFHVMLSNGVAYMTYISGLYLSNGNADSSGAISLGTDIPPRNRGGGLYFNRGNISIRDCSFQNNHANDEGGGLNCHFLVGNIYLDNVDFKNNHTITRGGGLNTESDSSFLNQVDFEGNSTDGTGAHFYVFTNVFYLENSNLSKGFATTSGGALSTNSSEIHISNSNFFDNESDSQGGSVRSTSCTMWIDSCQFDSCSATTGGAIYSSNDILYVTDCSFNDNRSSSSGGAIYANVEEFFIDRCRFIGNIGSAGGALVPRFGDDTDSLIITNSLFVNNRTANPDIGGTIWKSTGNTDILKIINCTFAESSQAGYSGALDINSGDLEIVNSVFWNNGNDLIVGGTTDTMGVTYSNIDIIGGGNNVHVNPMFFDTASYDYSLRLESPLLDQGLNDVVSGPGALDINGNPRIVRDTVDMGAYEFFYVFPCGQYETLAIDRTPIQSATYRADGLITSSGSVNMDSDGPVFYFSETGIDLMENFEVVDGVIFEAQVENPCDDD